MHSRNQTCGFFDLSTLAVPDGRDRLAPTSTAHHFDRASKFYDVVLSKYGRGIEDINGGNLPDL